MAVSQDTEHKFDLAIALGDIDAAYKLAEQVDSEEKWRKLSQAATLKSNFAMAADCQSRAKDYGALLLLAASAGKADLMSKIHDESKAAGQHNVSFLTSLLLGDTTKCLDILIETDRLPEAALFARTYCPSQVPRVISLWKDKAVKLGRKVSLGLLYSTFWS